MNALADHPTKAELSAFALGKLPEESSTVIEDHLAACESCSVTLASVADDTLIGLLASHDDADIHEGGWIDVRLDDPEQTAAQTETVVADLPTELVDHPRYRVLRLLGRGGMGDVYLAEHRLMERLVAIKVMKRKLMGRADAVERFRREVKTVAQLKHEYIVTAYDAEQAGDLHLLVMEYVEGRDLATEVKDRGPLPVHEACEHARQAALGLAHAHERGLVHRDIKPHNLMLVGGHVKILDLGLAQLAHAVAERSQEVVEEGAASLTGVRSVLGTPDYIAPEQISDAHRADHRADIYSLGATLYYLLAGQPPFALGSATDRITAHLTHAPTDIRQLRPDAPEELAHVIRRMMAKVPSQRYPAAEDVAEELAPFCIEPQRMFPEPQTASSNFWTWAIAPVFLALLTGGVWGFWQIVITIRDGDGKQTSITLEENLQATIRNEGDGRVGVDVSSHSPETDGRVGVGASSVRPAQTGTVFGAHSGPVYDVAYSHDGERIASASADETVRVWDAVTRRELARFSGHRLSSEQKQQIGAWGAVSVAFAPDGKRVLSGGWDGTARLWEIATGREIKHFGPYAGNVQGVDISPDGLIAATAHSQWSKHKDRDLNLVRLWNVETGELLHELKEHHHGLTSVSFSPDGRRLVSTSPDSTARVWDVETGEQLLVLQHESKVHQAQFSRDGRLIATACAALITIDGKINDPDHALVALWDAQSGEQLGTLRGHAGSVTTVDFSPDGRHLVSASGSDHLGEGPVPSVEYSIRIWDVASRTELLRFDSFAPLHRVRFSRDGKHVLSCEEHNVVRLWNLPGDLGFNSLPRDDAITLVGRLKGHEGPVFSVSASPDGKLIASASMDGTVRLWDSESGEQLRVLMTSSQPIRTAVFSPDGQHVLAAGHAQDVHLYEVATGEMVKTFETESGGAYRVAFSPDGQEAASIHYDGTLYRWDVATGHLIQQVKSPQGFGWAVDYSPAGGVLLGCWRDAIHVYDRETGKEIPLFTPRPDVPVGAFRNATFSPDGRTIAASILEGQIWLFNAEGRTSRRLHGHTAVVAGLAFTDNGKYLVSGGMDKQLCVWHLESGKKVASTKADVECVSWFTLLPKGRIVTGGETWDPYSGDWALDDDYALRIWRLPDFMLPSTRDGQSASTSQDSVTPAEP